MTRVNTERGNQPSHMCDSDFSLSQINVTLPVLLSAAFVGPRELVALASVQADPSCRFMFLV